MLTTLVHALHRRNGTVRARHDVHRRRAGHCVDRRTRLAMRPFVYDHPAQRVIFAAGALDRLPEEIARAGYRRVLMISTPGQRFAAAGRSLGGVVAATCDIAAMHVPIEAVHVARARAREANADSLLAIGGGSTIGLAKAVALERELPIVAVPTTYAGSEMTPIYGISEGGVKKTGRDARVLPRIVLYDPGSRRPSRRQSLDRRA